jgi:mycothiol synthase
MPITLSPADPGHARWSGILRRAEATDGVAAFNEQTELDIASERRRVRVAREADGAEVAIAVTGRGELDLVVDPRFRCRGVASAILQILLPMLPDPLTAWSHGDHPGAAALARHFDFDSVRRLLRLTLRLDGRGVASTSGAVSPDGIRIDAFRRDDALENEAWLRLNARIFRAHPEQGSVTAEDLGERMAEAWFNAGDFLVARDNSGAIVGYNWMKIEPGTNQGEIYVLGVAPELAGRGLGRRLLEAGLARLAARGCHTALLYVEGDNEPAVHLYRAAGFTEDVVDAQYRRRDAVA